MILVQFITSWGTLLASIVTAVATFFLWRVTGVLAIETKRMADASAQPQIVATLGPNQWSMRHLDINVENTGNATAFDIEVKFDPPLDRGGDADRVVPFQKISILKPGQNVSSYLREIGDYLEKTFTVTVTWLGHPRSAHRTELSYVLPMSDMKGQGNLGASDPLILMAQELKNLREDWQRVAAGSRRVEIDAYDAEDRRKEREELERRWGGDAGDL